MRYEDVALEFDRAYADTVVYGTGVILIKILNGALVCERILPARITIDGAIPPCSPSSTPPAPQSPK